MEQPSQVAAIAHIIQLAVAPVFLLAGIGSMLNVFASRLARIIDRARVLEVTVPTAGDEERGRGLAELRILDRRMAVVHWAINFAIMAALFVCLVVIILFVGDLVVLEFGRPVALIFILAMLSLTVALVLFLIEVAIATRFVRVGSDYVGRRNRLRRNGIDTVAM